MCWSDSKQDKTGIGQQKTDSCGYVHAGAQMQTRDGSLVTTEGLGGTATPGMAELVWGWLEELRVGPGTI